MKEPRLINSSPLKYLFMVMPDRSVTNNWQKLATKILHLVLDISDILSMFWLKYRLIGDLFFAVLFFYPSHNVIKDWIKEIDNKKTVWRSNTTVKPFPWLNQLANEKQHTWSLLYIHSRAKWCLWLCFSTLFFSIFFSPYFYYIHWRAISYRSAWWIASLSSANQLVALRSTSR